MLIFPSEASRQRCLKQRRPLLWLLRKYMAIYAKLETKAFVNCNNNYYYWLKKNIEYYESGVATIYNENNTGQELSEYLIYGRHLAGTGILVNSSG